jgi:hypothetical protein
MASPHIKVGGEKLPVALHDLARDEHGIDVLWPHAGNHRAEGIVSRFHCFQAMARNRRLVHSSRARNADGVYRIKFVELRLRGVVARQPSGTFHQ